MKKAILISLLVLVAFSSAALAQEFKDVPNGHWAESAVYKLVKLGVTKGYPDGTFRGNKSISRYETAMLISNLANAVGAGLSDADREKLKQEIKDEILAESGLGWKTSGMYHVRGFLTGLVGTNARALTPQHRLDLTISNVGIIKGSSFALHVDNRQFYVGPKDLAVAGNRLGLVSTGYQNWGFVGTDVFAMGNVDLYGKINFGELGILERFPIIFEASTGIGDMDHRSDKVKMTVDAGNFNAGLGYSRLNGVNNGIAGANKYSLYAGANVAAPGIGNTSINFEANAYNTTILPTRLSVNRAYNMKVTVTSQPTEYIKMQGIFGMTGKTKSGLLLGGKIWLNGGPLGNKVSVLAEGYKIGSTHQRNVMERYVDRDVFEYLLGDGDGNSETYIGAKVNYLLNEKFGIQFRMSMQFDGSGLGTLAWSTWEPMVTFSPSNRSKVYGAYRLWRNHAGVGTNSDRIEAGMMVNI